MIAHKLSFFFSFLRCSLVQLNLCGHMARLTPRPPLGAPPGAPTWRGWLPPAQPGPAPGLHSLGPMDSRGGFTVKPLDDNYYDTLKLVAKLNPN